MNEESLSALRRALIRGVIISQDELGSLCAELGDADDVLIEHLVHTGRLTFKQLAYWLNLGAPADMMADAAGLDVPPATTDHPPPRLHEEKHLGDDALRDIVLARRLLTPEQIDLATAEQEKTGHPLWRTFVNLRLLSTQVVADLMAPHAEAPRHTDSQDHILSHVLACNTEFGEARLQQITAGLPDGQSLADALIDRGEFSRAQLGAMLAEYFNVAFADLHAHPIPEELREALPASLLCEHTVAPVAISGATITVGMVNPHNQETLDRIAEATGRVITPSVVLERDLDAATAELRAAADGQDALANLRRHAAEANQQVSRLVATPGLELTENVSTVQLVDSIIEGAVKARSTDIHIEPQIPEMRIRYRIDGLLFDVMNIPDRLQLPIISRVKILAEMDITERRQPQDGHFNMQVNGQDYNMRVATLPTKLGEKLVIRILTESSVLTGLKQLGLDSEDLAVLKHLIARPHGMILATGPIGSGKTTTLYAALNELNILTNNIVTIEDPIEYRLAGINQLEIDPKSGLGFAEGLRSILRQDADIIMVGEVRDQETARVAVRAALTGQQVFTTMHTIDTPGAITTLHSLGVQPYLIASALNSVVAQRLVRTICTSCRRAYRPTEAMLEELGLHEHFGTVETLFYGEGCNACFSTGYRGRTGIFEILRMTETVKPLVIDRAPEMQIKAAAVSEGMIPLAMSGLKKVVSGITTPEEVMREVFL